MDLKKIVPWWVRIISKIMMSRLPIAYGIWKKIKLFEHGNMDVPRSAFSIFIDHAKTGGVLTESGTHLKVCHGSAFSVLELGPGDSLFTGVISNTLGATQTWLIDVGAFATLDADAYINLENFLRSKGYELKNSVNNTNIEQLLEKCCTTYLTSGVHSLGQLQDSVLDFCFSNAVLEHVAKSEFHKLAQELRRIIKPDGVCVHRVDLKDHMGGGLNNLRFTDATWEGSLFRHSGFYTNRIRFSEMVSIFRNAGFKCELTRVDRWNSLPIKRSRLAFPFSQLPDDELLVCGFDIVLRPKE